jgi:hypothetical protein
MSWCDSGQDFHAFQSCSLSLAQIKGEQSLTPHFEGGGDMEQIE